MTAEGFAKRERETVEKVVRSIVIVCVSMFRWVEIQWFKNKNQVSLGDWWGQLLSMTQKGNFLEGTKSHVEEDVTIFFAVVVWTFFFFFSSGSTSACEVSVASTSPPHLPPSLSSLLAMRPLTELETKTFFEKLAK